MSIENQKIMLSRYMQEQGWNLYAAYCDDGVSGTTFDRPMFNQMIADAKTGKINKIVGLTVPRKNAVIKSWGVPTDGRPF